MTLPLSGSLGMNDIRTELGIPSQAPFSLASASLGIYVPLNQNSFYRPTPSAPFTISSWYGYNHAASASPSPTPSITISPSRTPSITPSISISATPSVTPSISISRTPSVTPSISISATPSVTPSISISRTPSITPSISISRTPSVTPSISISRTPSVTPSTSTSVSLCYTTAETFVSNLNCGGFDSYITNRITITIRNSSTQSPVTSHANYTFQLRFHPDNGSGDYYQNIYINNGSSSGYVDYIASSTCNSDSYNTENDLITPSPSISYCYPAYGTYLYTTCDPNGRGYNTFHDHYADGSGGEYVIDTNGPCY
jgi:hypothetical protein